MSAVVIDGEGTGWVEQLARPVPGPYECLVRVRVCGFCNGTDLKLWHGGVGFTDVRYPTVLGHETAGEIVEVGERVRSYAVADRVVNPRPWIDPASDVGSAFGGMAQYGLVTDWHAMAADSLRVEGQMAQRVPNDMSFADAAMLHTLKEARSSLTNFGLMPGMKVLVYGDGPVGQALAAFARLGGAEHVVVAGHHRGRLDRIARVARPDAVVDPRSTDMSTLDAAGSFDLAIDAVGSLAVVYEAARLVRPGGKVGLYGVLPDGAAIEAFRLPTNVAIHVLMLPFGERDAHEPLLDLVASGAIVPSDYYSALAPAAEIEEIVRRTVDRSEFKIMVEL